MQKIPKLQIFQITLHIMLLSTCTSLPCNKPGGCQRIDNYDYYSDYNQQNPSWQSSYSEESSKSTESESRHRRKCKCDCSKCYNPKRCCIDFCNECFIARPTPIIIPYPIPVLYMRTTTSNCTTTTFNGTITTIAEKTTNGTKTTRKKKPTDKLLLLGHSDGDNITTASEYNSTTTEFNIKNTSSSAMPKTVEVHNSTTSGFLNRTEITLNTSLTVNKTLELLSFTSAPDFILFEFETMSMLPLRQSQLQRNVSTPSTQPARKFLTTTSTMPPSKSFLSSSTTPPVKLFKTSSTLAPPKREHFTLSSLPPVILKTTSTLPALSTKSTIFRKSFKRIIPFTSTPQLKLVPYKIPTRPGKTRVVRFYENKGLKTKKSGTPCMYTKYPDGLSCILLRPTKKSKSSSKKAKIRKTINNNRRMMPEEYIDNKELTTTWSLPKVRKTKKVLTRKWTTPGTVVSTQTMAHKVIEVPPEFAEKFISDVQKINEIEKDEMEKPFYVVDVPNVDE